MANPTEIHIPHCVTVVFRCRYKLGWDETCLAILGSDASLGCWDIKRPLYARQVGRDFWEAHAYLNHGTSVWWKWIVLNRFGIEKRRENIPDRCLEIAGDSLSVTALWNGEMQTQLTWDGLTRDCHPLPRAQPGNNFVGYHPPPLVYDYPPPWGTKDMITPSALWDMYKDRTCVPKSPDGVTCPSEPDHNWTDNENRRLTFLNRPPSSGLGSSLHQQQMTKAERLSIDYTKTETPNNQMPAERLACLNWKNPDITIHC